MKKKVIIIGAGVSGLASGVYLAKSGFDVQIFEKNDKCGGLCTTTHRNGYAFESCLYWVFGSNRNNSLYKMWEELGVVAGCDFIQFDEYMRLEYEKGSSLTVYSNLNHLCTELKAISPEDSVMLDELLVDVKKTVNFSLPYEKPRSLWCLKDYIIFVRKAAPFLPLILKYKNMSYIDFVNKLESKELQDVFMDLLSFFPNYPMIMVMLIFANMDARNANYPRGGSLFLAEAIENRLNEVMFKSPIAYNSPVRKIIIENNKAIGVILDNGVKHYADYVISCSDGYNSIFNMLGGKYGSKRLKRRYSDLPVFHSYMQISFGVNRDMSKEHQFIVYKLKKPIKLGDNSVSVLRIRHYCFNENFAPKGKSSLVITFDSDYGYWNELYNNSRDKYNAEKQRVKNEVLAVLNNRFEGIAEQIEMTDVATPKTFERFSGNRNGSAEGWDVNCKTLTVSFPYTLKGLSNFYMAGHWTNINGSIMTAGVTARQVAQLICRKEKVEFQGVSK